MFDEKTINKFFFYSGKTKHNHNLLKYSCQIQCRFVFHFYSSQNFQHLYMVSDCLSMF